VGRDTGEDTGALVVGRSVGGDTGEDTGALVVGRSVGGDTGEDTGALVVGRDTGELDEGRDTGELDEGRDTGEDTGNGVGCDTISPTYNNLSGDPPRFLIFPSVASASNLLRTSSVLRP